MTYIPAATTVPVNGGNAGNPAYAQMIVSPDGQSIGHVTELLYDILQVLRGQSEAEEAGGVAEDDS